MTEEKKNEINVNKPIEEDTQSCYTQHNTISQIEPLDEFINYENYRILSLSFFLAPFFP